ncbi:MAG: hypothetical protein ACRD2O_15100 [Terriglobia bacterium]
MTFEEMERSVSEWRDNQVVQGQLLHRTETNLDRLEGVVEQNSHAIGRLADGMVLLQSAMRGLIQTVEGLSATVDRFIRGMEGDGHHK